MEAKIKALQEHYQRTIDNCNFWKNHHLKNKMQHWAEIEEVKIHCYENMLLDLKILERELSKATK